MLLRRDLETVLKVILSGQYAYPLRIVCFNAIEGWSRDATSDIADALAEGATDTDVEITPALQGFIEANSTKPFKSAAGTAAAELSRRAMVREGKPYDDLCVFSESLCDLFLPGQ